VTSDRRPTDWDSLPLKLTPAATSTLAQSQPCALCGGATVRRDILPGYQSNHCPRCGAWTASSDGREADRKQSYVDIAWPIALRLAREGRSRRQSRPAACGVEAVAAHGGRGRG